MARKTLSIIIPALLLLAAAAQFASCEKYILPELNAGPDTLHFSCHADSLAINVTTNVIFEAFSEEEWVSFNPEWGEVDCTIMAIVEENTEGPRQTVISIKSETIKRDLTVIQDGPETEPETE